MFSTFVTFPPSGTLTYLEISSFVNGVFVTGVSISLTGVTFTGTSTVITFPFGNSTVTLTGSFLPGVVKSGMFSTFVTLPPSGTLTYLEISSFVKGVFVTGVSIGFGLASTTLIVAGTSTNTFPFLSFTTTVTGLSPTVVESNGSVCPSGTLYSNVEPSG